MLREIMARRARRADRRQGRLRRRSTTARRTSRCVATKYDVIGGKTGLHDGGRLLLHHRREVRRPRGRDGVPRRARASRRGSPTSIASRRGSTSGAPGAKSSSRQAREAREPKIDGEVHGRVAQEPLTPCNARARDAGPGARCSPRSAWRRRKRCCGRAAAARARRCAGAATADPRRGPHVAARRASRRSRRGLRAVARARGEPAAHDGGVDVLGAGVARARATASC